MRARLIDMTSLRTRLVLVPTAILFLGLAATLLFIVAGARARVQAEVGSGLRLGALVVQDALRAAAAQPDPQAAVARLRAAMPEVRHVRFLPDTADAADRPAAFPAWFARLLAPPAQTTVFAVGNGQPPILMRSHPEDEIDEIWSEVLLLAAVLFGVWLALTGLVWLTVGRSLRPLRLLAAGFDRLERGAYDPIPPLPVAELRRIGGQFNALAAALDRVTQDNHLLIDRLMSLQEAERGELAHELHDEIGPLLFGIRAEAACIQRHCRAGPPPPAAIADRAAAIDALADDLQQSTYRMLDRLRPLLLAELGLADAARALLDAWRARLPEIEWTAEIAPDLGEVDAERGLTLYRFMQEGLTNAARHADARQVRLRLRRPPEGGLHAALQDDGIGLRPDFHYGFGLLGMNERARRLGGRLAVRPAPGGGTLVELELPDAMREAA